MQGSDLFINLARLEAKLLFFTWGVIQHSLMSKAVLPLTSMGHRIKAFAHQQLTVSRAGREGKTPKGNLECNKFTIVC